MERSEWNEVNIRDVIGLIRYVADKIPTGLFMFWQIVK